jgi:nucleoside-diphosphate-sugar epimerase
LFKNKKILVRGKLNKRPFIHIKDVVRAYQSIIDAPKEKICGQIFNVGSEEQNFEMGKLAQEIVKASSIDCDIELNDTNDHRSYFASFQKIRESIGYSTKYTVSEGVMEMYDALDIKTKTVEWYKKLLSDQILAKQYLLNNRIL